MAIKQPVGCVLPPNGLERSRCRVSGSPDDTHAAQLIRIDALDEHACTGEGEEEGHADKDCEYEHWEFLSPDCCHYSWYEKLVPEALLP